MYFIVFLLLLISPALPAQDVRLLLCPQDPVVEGVGGKDVRLLRATHLGSGVWGVDPRRRMTVLSQKLSLVSQGRADEVRGMPDGDALDFRTCLYHTEQIWADTLHLLEEGYPSVVLACLRVWDRDSLLAVFGAVENKALGMDLSEVMGRLAPGQLREEKPVRRGRPVSRHYDGLRYYTYRGKPCLVVWDDVSKCEYHESVCGFAQSVSGETLFDFSYSLEDVQQVVLCRYSPECYVLLLLTQPMVAMD